MLTFAALNRRIISLAEQKAAGEDAVFAYQIHAWVGSLYVDCVPWTVRDSCPTNPGTLVCPSAAAVARFDAAIRAGHIVYTGSPFNIDAQAVGDPALFEDLVTDIAGSLDARYHRPAGARVWSNVDVKGFARSSIPLMRKAGVEFLSIGQNGHPSNDHGGHSRGMQPAVGGSNATMFRWRDPRSGQDITVLYHDGYGGPFLQDPLLGNTGGADDCIVSPNGVALASYFRSDNAGPPSSKGEVMRVMKATQKLFRNAKVVPSSFDAFAEAALPPSVTTALPVFEQDWGDQWLTGVSTDPTRLSVYRAVMRSRATCISAGHPECARHSAVMKNVTRWLAKVSEHTQGAQGEQWSPGTSGLPTHAAGGGDTSHWSNSEFAKVHSATHNIWESGELTWVEARVFSELAVSAIPAGSAWRVDVEKRLDALIPRVPDVAGLKAVGLPATGGQTVVACGGMRLGIDGAGAITSLRLSAGVDDWAAIDSPLMKLSYVTYNKLETWDTKRNLTCSESGCANPTDAVWSATLTGLWHNGSAAQNGTAPPVCRVVARSAFGTHLHEDSGAPAAVWTVWTLLPATRAVAVEISWTNKTTTRLPESFMVDLRPQPKAGFGWGMDILGEIIRPNETAGGTTNQWQKAIWHGVQYSAEQGLAPGGLQIDSYDAAMACPIVKSSHPMASKLLGGSTPIGEGIDPTPITLDQVAGMAFNLYNNLMPISGFAQW